MEIKIAWPPRQTIEAPNFCCHSYCKEDHSVIFRYSTPNFHNAPTRRPKRRKVFRFASSALSVSCPDSHSIRTELLRGWLLAYNIVPNHSLHSLLCSVQNIFPALAGILLQNGSRMLRTGSDSGSSRKDHFTPHRSPAFTSYQAGKSLLCLAT